jgi:DNA anti-recombination protein RmuC
MDRNTLKALIASRRNVSEDDAERMVSRLEALRDEYVARAEQMRDEVNRRIVQVKTEALHQADEARKTAALAAWWVFGSAVVSGIAAVLGGLVGATTGPF